MNGPAALSLDHFSAITPHRAFEEIADQIREVRRRTSMSYVGVFPTQMDAFAPVLALLKGE